MKNKNKLPEAGHYGSKHELSAMAKVKPEAEQYAPSPLEGEGWGEGFKKQAAFTLAEVLITLGIIGVVAAMTIPTLTKNYQRRVLKTRFLQSYNIASHAMLKTKQELGENLMSVYTVYESGRGYYKASEFMNTFLKYCNYTGTIMPNYYMSNYNNTKTYSTADNIGGDYPTPRYLLRNGSSINVLVNNFAIWVYIDTNGPTQKPNRYGYDIFTFKLTKKDALEPIKMTSYYEDEAAATESGVLWAGIQGTPCTKKSNQRGNGRGCSWYAFHDQNPDDASKGYWESLDF